jgi:hypothetical protein
LASPLRRRLSIQRFLIAALGLRLDIQRSLAIAQVVFISLQLVFIQLQLVSPLYNPRFLLFQSEHFTFECVFALLEQVFFLCDFARADFAR